jgi:N-acetyl-gamma-glutamylphosphate reductase
MQEETHQTKSLLHSSAYGSPQWAAKAAAGAYGKPGCFTYVPPDGVVWKD